MKRLFSLILVMCLMLSLCALSESEAAAAPLPADNLVVTEHSATIDGTAVDYTATTGTMVMETTLGQYEMFFTAYTLKGVEDPAQRPITFAFNGGPGSASLWLHVGLLGPERIAVSDEGMVEQVPTGHKANEYSILDLTDLVLIDSVGTGYSRAVEGTDENAFYSLSGDIASVGDFIRQYVSRYDRWASPKYLAGESYGTARAVGLCDYLLNTHHMNLNGLMLISSANDYGVLEETPGNEMPYICFLPTYAAAARYHKKVSQEYQDMLLEDYMDEVRAFAIDQYLPALFQGTRLGDDEADQIAQRLSDYIGLSKAYILKKNLRISMTDFCTELLSDEALMVGRMDSRFTGPLINGSADEIEMFDPSTTGIMEAFTSAFLDYVSRELGYHTDVPYVVLGMDVNRKWSFDSDNQALTQENVIRKCLSANEYLKIWVLCGYYDLATPFFGSEWIFSHIFENKELRDNVSFSYYPSGHMFYLLDSSLEKFRTEAAAWYGEDK